MNLPNEHTYRAEIIPCGYPENTDRLLILRAIPGIEFIDTMPAQVADLVRTRAPATVFDERSLGSAVKSFLHENGDERYGVWVYYAWSKRVVRLLAEADFIELRTSRNQHKITTAEQRSLASRKIGIIGLSVGQSVALTMALERACGELRIADFDAIDLSNLNRLRCGVHNLGVLKTIAAAREIAEIDPYLRVVCFHDGYTAANEDAFLEGLDVVVDECDSLDIKLRLRESARERRIPVLMSTSDRGMIDIERFDAEPARPIFHGRLNGIQAGDLVGLSTEQKVPILMDLAGLPTSSVRLRASLLEIGESIKTWPQLAADVTFGGAAVCDVARRLLLGEPVASGCYYTDFTHIGDASKALSTVPINTAQSCELDHSAIATTPIRDRFDLIVADAGLAPSEGNSQPWQWKKTSVGLDLRRRRLNLDSSHDADDHNSLIALGAALETAVISARQHGLETDVCIDLAGDSIARLSLTTSVQTGDEPLYRQIRRRRSVRTCPAQISALPEPALEMVRAEVARFPGLQTRFLQTRPEIRELAELAGAAERLRMLDPRHHAEWARHVCWSDDEHRYRREGVPVSALSVSAAEQASLELLRDPQVVSVLSRFELGERTGKLIYRQMDTSSAIGLLWSKTNTPLDSLAGGRALQRMWLAATAADVGLCPVTACCTLLNAWRAGQRLSDLQSREIPKLEERLQRLFDLPPGRCDITLFRLVPAREALAAPPATLRLPPADILM